MARRFILPIADLVDEYAQYDGIFSFYDDGIRGLIRDAVFESSLRQDVPLLLEHHHQRHQRNVDPLVEYTLDRFYNNLEAEERCNAFSDFFRETEPVVRAVTEAVTFEIWHFMCTFLGTTNFVVRDSVSWIDRDLDVLVAFGEPVITQVQEIWTFTPIPYRRI